MVSELPVPLSESITVPLTFYSLQKICWSQPFLNTIFRIQRLRQRDIVAARGQNLLRVGTWFKHGTHDCNGCVHSHGFIQRSKFIRHQDCLHCGLGTIYCLSLLECVPLLLSITSKDTPVSAMMSVWFDCVSSRFIAGSLVLSTAVLEGSRTFKEGGSNISALGHWGSAPGRWGSHWTQLLHKGSLFWLRNTEMGVVAYL